MLAAVGYGSGGAAAPCGPVHPRRQHVRTEARSMVCSVAASCASSGLRPARRVRVRLRVRVRVWARVRVRVRARARVRVRVRV